MLAAYRRSLNSNKGIGINEPFPPDHRDCRCGVVCGAPTFGAEQAAESRFPAMRRKIMKRMIDAMPEDSPPKLVMSILPRLQEQNDQILALLKEQTDLLRNGAQSASSRSRRRLGRDSAL